MQIHRLNSESLEHESALPVENTQIQAIDSGQMQSTVTWHTGHGCVAQKTATERLSITFESCRKTRNTQSYIKPGWPFCFFLHPALCLWAHNTVSSSDKHIRAPSLCPCLPLEEHHRGQPKYSSTHRHKRGLKGEPQPHSPCSLVAMRWLCL